MTETYTQSLAEEFAPILAATISNNPVAALRFARSKMSDGLVASTLLEAVASDPKGCLTYLSADLSNAQAAECSRAVTSRDPFAALQSNPTALTAEEIQFLLKEHMVGVPAPAPIATPSAVEMLPGILDVIPYADSRITDRIRVSVFQAHPVAALTWYGAS